MKLNALPLEGDGKGGGEISGLAETQPPSQPSPCQGEGVIANFPVNKAGK